MVDKNRENVWMFFNYVFLSLLKRNVTRLPEVVLEEVEEDGDCWDSSGKKRVEVKNFKWTNDKGIINVDLLCVVGCWFMEDWSVLPRSCCLDPRSCSRFSDNEQSGFTDPYFLSFKKLHFTSLFLEKVPQRSTNHPPLLKICCSVQLRNKQKKTFNRPSHVHGVNKWKKSQVDEEKQ